MYNAVRETDATYEESMLTEQPATSDAVEKKLQEVKNKLYII
jgi:hypothetical protein